MPQRTISQPSLSFFLRWTKKYMQEKFSCRFYAKNIDLNWRRGGGVKTDIFLKSSKIHISRRNYHRIAEKLTLALSEIGKENGKFRKIIFTSLFGQTVWRTQLQNIWKLYYISKHWNYPILHVTKNVLWCIWIYQKFIFGGGIWASRHPAVFLFWGLSKSVSSQRQELYNYMELRQSS